jgi:O-acetyl-ADP-ribose deacetylase (regulator of RNase III)
MTIELLKADITSIPADVIVNAANSSLLGGGGVDGAIHKKGGPAILQECVEIRNRQGSCRTGQAVITTAGNLPAKKVIHTVGPVWNNGISNEEALLAECYTNSLMLAFGYHLKTIAFPNISTGIYHFPKEKAAEIAIASVTTHEHFSYFDKIIFVCFDEENYSIYKNLLPHE